VRLTELMPHQAEFGPDGFYAAAEAPGLTRDFHWSVTAYAICAWGYLLRDHEIVGTALYNADSRTFESVSAACPGDTVALGSGAAVQRWPGYGPTGQLGLQMNRTSGPLDISRATGRESASGYGGPWKLIYRAICATPLVPYPYLTGLYVPASVHSETNIMPGPFSIVGDACDPGFRTHGSGGGGGLIDGGPVWLQRIAPRANLSGTDVRLTGPTTTSVGGVLVHQACANG
jgi:hypothetical protein